MSSSITRKVWAKDHSAKKYVTATNFAAFKQEGKVYHSHSYSIAYVLVLLALVGWALRTFLYLLHSTIHLLTT